MIKTLKTVKSDFRVHQQENKYEHDSTVYKEKHLEKAATALQQQSVKWIQARVNGQSGVWRDG